ncbi:MAG: Leu/Phe/Val dehydrogenase [Gemmatimonadales bacterium]
MSRVFEHLASGGHELVALSGDAKSGYRGIIAIHSTTLGPAVGGTRWWTYPTESDAIVDALRLSRGMSYKNAMAGLPLGGGKAVIMAPDVVKDRAAILRAHGHFVDRFGGRFITAEDVGTSLADMEIIAEGTRFVAGRVGGSGDPSPHTARGVYRAMQAAARMVWGSDDLAGRSVAIQGVGNVGLNLARQLHDAGVTLRVSDVDPNRVATAVRELGATAESPDTIHASAVDIFAPCALGASLSDRTIPEIRAAIVVGAANNQLAESRHGHDLARRGIFYVPDYVANAGGVCFGGAIEVLAASPAEALARVNGIYDTTLGVLERARTDEVPPFVAADRIAEERISSGKLEPT